jgi:hypothetical protein
MSTDAQLAFADQFGRHVARQYGLPPIAGRVAGWLLICDPPRQTVAELADALQASRTAVSGAVATLERLALVQRTRAAGERADRITVEPGFGTQSMDDPTEYVALGALARRGLEALGDAPPSRRARLLELAAFADFLAERSPALAAEWRARREALRASGELPDP